MNSALRAIQTELRDYADVYTAAISDIYYETARLVNARACGALLH